MKYVLITADKTKFIVSKEERDSVLQSVNSGAKAILIQDTLISLAIAPSVIPFDRWWAQQEDDLARSEKRRCKKCLRIFSAEGVCPCWESGGGKERDAFVAPLKELQGIKLLGWPELTNFEKSQVLYEEGQAVYLDFARAL